MKKLNNDEFIKRCKDVHGDKYDYSLTKYTSIRNKIKIICPNHGEIEILPSNHLYNKSGCDKCKRDEHKLTELTEERLEKLKRIHGNKYLYEDLSVNASKIKIICKEHGEFTKNIYQHEKGIGCNKCKKEKEVNEFKNNLEKCLDFLNNPKTKKCLECDSEKDINFFPLHSNGNHRNYCEDCFSIRSRLQKEKYKRNNREKIRESDKRRRKNKMENDPIYKSKIYARNLIRKSISKMGYSKKSKTYEILGCSYLEFKEHLESNFLEGMNWNNRELWHIDHFIPLSFAQNEEEVLLLNNYKNLKPIWPDDNILKSDMIIEKNEIYYKILEIRNLKKIILS
jgi:hypothetical protein